MSDPPPQLIELAHCVRLETEAPDGAKLTALKQHLDVLWLNEERAKLREEGVDFDSYFYLPGRSFWAMELCNTADELVSTPRPRRTGKYRANRHSPRGRAVAPCCAGVERY